MADAHVETSEVNQDSLDGAQPTVSDVGSAEEFEKEREEDTPSASNGDAEEDGNTGDVPEEVQGEESREAEGAADEVAALPVAEEEASNQETENGHQNGHNGANGDKPEADSTELDALDASIGEKRKSLGGEEDLSAKKARLEGDEAEVVPPTTNGQQEAAA